LGVAVANFEEAQICIQPLQQLEYTYRGEYGIARRHYFVKGEPRTHHLHMVEVSSTTWKESLFFRDYLREHREAAAEYARIKMQLGACCDRERYQAEKGAFIAQVLRQMPQAATAVCHKNTNLKSDESR
jgi:GrpB-like predicted nucleotidyltransferase (UPF0157 family)